MTNGPFISDDDDSASAAMLPPPPETSSSANSTSTSHLKNFNNEKKKKEEIADETLIEQPKKSSLSNNNNNNNNNTTNSKSSFWSNGKTKASLISLAIVIFVLVFAVVFFSTSKKEHSPSDDDDDGGESAFRREFLRNMTRETWNALMKGGGNNFTSTSTSATKTAYDKHRGQAIVTAMSTLHLMSLTEEFEAGKAWIAENLSNLKTLDDVEVKVLLGDYLGGLLSCFALTKDVLFKEKALEVLKALEPAFTSPTGLLYSHLNLKTGKPFGRRTAISWIGHQQPELIVAINVILSSGETEQQQKLLLQGRLKVIERFVAERMTTVRGLYMHIVDVESGAWLHQITTLGSRGIDFYYNLLRAHLLLRKGSSDGKDDDDDHLMVMATFVEAMEAVIRAGMLRKSTKNGLTYALEYNLASESYAKAMATSACRLSGMLALASSITSKVAQSDQQKKGNLTSERMLELAISLTETCYQTANRTATKLLPLELWTSGQISNSNRPQSSSSSSSSAALGSFNGFYELAESYLQLWKSTGNGRYREYGWQLTEALYRHARTEDGQYAAVRDVNSVRHPASLNTADHRSVHFLGATFKYLYLLFSDDGVLPTNRWVFNAFGQPLPVVGVL